MQERGALFLSKQIDKLLKLEFVHTPKCLETLNNYNVFIADE